MYQTTRIYGSSTIKLTCDELWDRHYHTYIGIFEISHSLQSCWTCSQIREKYNFMFIPLHQVTNHTNLNLTFKKYKSLIISEPWMRYPHTAQLCSAQHQICRKWDEIFNLFLTKFKIKQNQFFHHNQNILFIFQLIRIIR